MTTKDEQDIQSDKYDNMGLRELLEEMGSLERARLSKSNKWCCRYGYDGQYFYADIPEDAIRQALRSFDNS